MKDVSEFKASQDLELYTKDGKPSGSEEGAIPVKISRGGKIPKMFVQIFLLHNRNYIENLEYKNGIPILSKSQEKEYDVRFELPKPEKMQIKKHKWTREKLTVKLNELKSKSFKEWIEKEFGDVDRRKSSSALITEILIEQDKAKG